MPLSFSEEGEQLADKSPCADIRARLKMCLLDSDCCKKVKLIMHMSFFLFEISSSVYFDETPFDPIWQHQSSCLENRVMILEQNYNFSVRFVSLLMSQEHVLPRDCLKRNDHTVPEECHHLKYTFFECKRSIVSIYFYS